MWFRTSTVCRRARGRAASDLRDFALQRQVRNHSHPRLSLMTASTHPLTPSSFPQLLCREARLAQSTAKKFRIQSVTRNRKRRSARKRRASCQRRGPKAVHVLPSPLRGSLRSCRPWSSLRRARVPARSARVAMPMVQPRPSPRARPVKLNPRNPLHFERTKDTRISVLQQVTDAFLACRCTAATIA